MDRKTAGPLGKRLLLAFPVPSGIFASRLHHRFPCDRHFSTPRRIEPCPAIGAVSYGELQVRVWPARPILHLDAFCSRKLRHPTIPRGFSSTLAEPSRRLIRIFSVHSWNTWAAQFTRAFTIRARSCLMKMAFGKTSWMKSRNLACRSFVIREAILFPDTTGWMAWVRRKIGRWFLTKRG